MHECVIKVKAQLKMLPPSEGERESPIYSGYRPNHNFGGIDDNDFYPGEIKLENDNNLSYEIAAIINFIGDNKLSSILKPNVKWRIQEANRLVGVGEVLEVLNEEKMS